MYHLHCESQILIDMRSHANVSKKSVMGLINETQYQFDRNPPLVLELSESEKVFATSLGIKTTVGYLS